MIATTPKQQVDNLPPIIDQKNPSCAQCGDTGVKTDDNGIQYDDVCPVCEGHQGTEE